MAAPISSEVALPLDVAAVLEGLVDAVIAAGASGVVVFANAAAADLLGRPVAELVGAALVDLMPERLRDDHRTGFARFLRTREPTLVGKAPVRVAALRGDGEEIEVELSLSMHTLSGGGEVFFGLLRDLGDRVELERERALARYLEALRAVTSRLAHDAGAAEPDDAVVAAVETLGETLGWDAGAVWVPEHGLLRARRGWARPDCEEITAVMKNPDLAFEAGVGLPGRVWGSREACWISDVAADSNFARAGMATRVGVRSAVAFPIVVDDAVVAVAELFSRARRFVDVDLLAALNGAGTEIGRFVERAVARRRDAEVRAHLVEMAQALQASLLPPQPPAIAGLEVAARYRAAAGEGEVGGDFFDVFPVGSSASAVVIGDVSGRGPGAAALTALARYTIRGAAVRASSPADVLRVLNEVIRREVKAVDESQFITVAFAVVESSADGALVRLACGGHPPPLLVHANGRVEEVMCRGTLVGVLGEFDVEDVEITLTPGDALVLFTDGLFEAQREGDQFGEERLAAAAATNAGASAEAIAEAITSAVAAFVVGGGQDDQALVVLRVPPDGPASVDPRMLSP